MSDLKVVYTASQGGAASALNMLRRQGLNPRLLDIISPMATVHPTFSGSTGRVRVAVPEEEVEAATDLLRLWEEESKPAVRDIARKLRMVFLLATIVTAIIVGILWHLHPSVYVAAAALFIWIFLAAILGWLLA
jgi:hypothetical protein